MIMDGIADRMVSKVHPWRRFILALLIIGPSFALIGCMIFIPMSDMSDKTRAFYGDFFQVILPLLAAWVGAVIAFYFSSESIEKAQETLQRVMTPKDDLSSRTVEDLVKEHPSVKEVQEVTMESTVGDVKGVFDKLTNTVVVDSDYKPLGILYEKDFKLVEEQYRKKQSTEPGNDKLGNFIECIKEDLLTKSPWDKTRGVDNYAKLSLNDNLYKTQEKMQYIARSRDNILYVRGIVTGDDSKVVAIINFANITSGII